MHQGLSQDLENGCQKLAIVNIVGILSLKGNNNILTFKHLNMYLHIEIRHDLLYNVVGII